MGFGSGLIIGLIGGALATLTIEHGWGWVLEQYHKRTGK